MKTVKVRSSGLNPFLINPIKAFLNNEDTEISHCLATDKGIVCILEIQGKSSQALLEEVEFLNTHEFDRFKTMLKTYAKQGNYLRSSDCLEYGIKV